MPLQCCITSFHTSMNEKYQDINIGKNHGAICNRILMSMNKSLDKSNK